MDKHLKWNLCRGEDEEDSESNTRETGLPLGTLNHVPSRDGHETWRRQVLGSSPLAAALWACPISQDTVKCFRAAGLRQARSIGTGASWMYDG